MTYMSLVIVSSFVSRYHPCFTRTTRPRAPAASATHTRPRPACERGTFITPRALSLTPVGCVPPHALHSVAALSSLVSLYLGWLGVSLV